MKIKETLIALTLVALASGCALIPQGAKDKVAQGVKTYCASMTQPQRAIFRAEVNAAIAPNSVKVHCDGDVE